MKLLLLLLLIATHVQAQFDPLERPWPARMSHRVMDDGSMALVTIDGQIFRASDTGWVKDRRASFHMQHRELLPGLEDQATVTLINDSAALAVYHTKPSILRTVNRGQSWEEVKALTERSSAQQFLSRWKGVQAFGNRLFLNNGDHQVFVSKDKGINWSVIRIGEPGLDSITSMSWHEQRGLVGCTSNRLHLSRDSGRTWSRIPTPFDQQQTIRAYGKAAAGISTCGLFGNWLIVEQNGSVFYSPTDQIRWARLPGVFKFHIELVAGRLYTFSHDRTVTCYNKELVQVYRHRTDLYDPVFVDEFLQKGDSLFFTGWSETGIITPEGVSVHPYYLGLEYRDLEKRSWTLGNTRWTFNGNYLLRKDSSEVHYQGARRFPQYIIAHPRTDGRISVVTELEQSYQILDPLTNELLTDPFPFPFEECAGDSIVVLELIRVRGPNMDTIRRWVRTGPVFLPSADACIDRRFYNSPTKLDLLAIPSDSVSRLVQEWNKPFSHSFDHRIEGEDRELYMKVASWWRSQQPEGRYKPYPGLHLPWISNLLSNMDSIPTDPPKIEEELLQTVYGRWDYNMYGGPYWMIRMKTYMGRVTELGTGAYPSDQITSLGTWRNSVRGLGISQSSNPAIRAFVERYAGPDFIFSQRELHVFWLFKATQRRFHRWLAKQ